MGMYMDGIDYTEHILWCLSQDDDLIDGILDICMALGDDVALETILDILAICWSAAEAS